MSEFQVGLEVVLAGLGTAAAVGAGLTLLGSRLRRGGGESEDVQSARQRVAEGQSAPTIIESPVTKAAREKSLPAGGGQPGRRMGP